MVKRCILAAVMETSCRLAIDRSKGSRDIVMFSYLISHEKKEGRV
jgi:hypothetical protein